MSVGVGLDHQQNTRACASLLSDDLQVVGEGIEVDLGPCPMGLHMVVLHPVEDSAQSRPFKA